MSKYWKEEAKTRRHKRVRKKVAGLSSRPRLCVYRSNKNIYAQIIDDVKRVTLVSASTLEKIDEKNKVEDSYKVGSLIAKRALEKGIKEVVFDRGGNLYHGRVKALADGARENGLVF
ncbi:MAG: 50S ribosomal protein L18 [Actinobacteria bacterium]|nr:50S ribosomal protein L18 [Actinomycetota bacterium]